MTQAQIDKAMAHYQQALADGTITHHEFEGFIEALRKEIAEADHHVEFDLTDSYFDITGRVHFRTNRA